MLVKGHLDKSSNYYPYLYSGSAKDGFLSNNFYSKLKKSTNALLSNNSMKLDHGGQEYRTNITIRADNENLQQLQALNHPLAQFFDILNSTETRLFLYSQFKSDLMVNGFIGRPISAFLESNLELQYCEASKSYENPFHVDTRKRVVHGLLYMGKENLQGGNLLLAKHKLRNHNEYPQIPDLDDLYDYRVIEPLDNTGLLILSTPNSYHKGQCSAGRRRFCYWGYNYMENKNCWVSSPSWEKPLKFKEAVQLQNGNSTPTDPQLPLTSKCDTSAKISAGLTNICSDEQQIISELEERVDDLNKQLRGVYSAIASGLDNVK